MSTPAGLWWPISRSARDLRNSASVDPEARDRFDEGGWLSARIACDMQQRGESPKVSFRLNRTQFELLRSEALRTGCSVHAQARDQLVRALEGHDLLDVREAIHDVERGIEDLRHDLKIALQLVLLNLSGRKATREEVEEFVTSKLAPRRHRGL